MTESATLFPFADLLGSRRRSLRHLSSGGCGSCTLHGRIYGTPDGRTLGKTNTRSTLLSNASPISDTALLSCPSRCPTLTAASSPRSSLPLAISPSQWVRDLNLGSFLFAEKLASVSGACHLYQPNSSYPRPGLQIRPYLGMIFNVLRAACPYAVKPEVRPPKGRFVCPLFPAPDHDPLIFHRFVKLSSSRTTRTRWTTSTNCGKTFLRPTRAFSRR